MILNGAVTDEGRFTLYDAREAHPTRTEWRLYYSVERFRLARVGDLMVLFREPDDALVAIVARPGTPVEAELVRLLTRGEAIDLERFQYRDAPVIGQLARRSRCDTRWPRPPPQRTTTRERWRTSSGRSRATEMPSSLAMVDIAARLSPGPTGPLDRTSSVPRSRSRDRHLLPLEDRINSPKLVAMQAAGAT